MQELLDVLRVEPFVPFRIHMTGGKTHDVRHPDQALVLRSAVVLPIISADGVPERQETLSLVHIVRVEQLAPPFSSNGA
jgi:hypothetical protein